MNSEALRLVRLSILGSVAILPALVLPGMVGALVDHADFSESAAGWIAAVGSFGGALGAILVGLRIHHFDPRKLAVGGLLVLAVFDASSVLVAELPLWLFLAIRAGSGLGGAAAYAAVMASIAASSNPERGYGTFMVFQFALSAAGLYALPMALPDIGVTGMYLILAGAAVLSLTQTSAVVHREAEVRETAIELHMILKPAALLALVGIGLFEAANYMHFTYAERIGLTFGLTLHRIGEILGFATLVGIPAAFGVVWLGDRYGQLGPLTASLLLVVVALAWLIGATTSGAYILIMCALSVAWAFGLPYFQAVAARLDPGGSVIVVAGFFTSGGAALGPAAAAILVAPDGYSDVLLVAIGTYGVVACLMALSVRYARSA